jgi:undecaprenyl-diphosphatase
MAAAALWLMVPVVLSLYTSSRRLWWASVVASVAAVGLIGASRVYLDVHWATDVVGGVLAAAMLLAGLDTGFRIVHGRRLCCGSPTDVPTGTVAGSADTE